ncbi:hypothetical protein ACIRQP_18515 [Streptomyces sp. NPDC102274]|uniref:hypothetical protein n=1 Tax=Streptomyces sp. NPDC102274 TaxID=3366151 RepID=UPI0037FA1091
MAPSQPEDASIMAGGFSQFSARLVKQNIQAQRPDAPDALDSFLPFWMCAGYDIQNQNFRR